MPYTDPKLDRPIVDKEIDNLVAKFRYEYYMDKEESYSHKRVNGAANYIITRVILGLLKPVSGWNYESLSDVVKTLESSKAEIQRRLLAPYEDMKIDENGDLKEFSEPLQEIYNHLLTEAIKKNPITGP